MPPHAKSTGAGTSRTNDVSDPHPSNEGHPDRERHPGGANPPKTDNSTNDAVHTGKGERKPEHTRRQ